MQISSFVPVLNLTILLGLCAYVSFKAKGFSSAVFFVLSLLSLALFELGSLALGLDSSWSKRGAALALFGAAAVPVTLIPFAQTLARAAQTKIDRRWVLFHVVQLGLAVVLAVEIFTGRMIEWVTGILDQPIFLIENKRRFLFLNALAAAGIALLCFENALRNATKFQQERMRYLFIACLGIVVYFAYLAVQILVSSYVSLQMLASGSVINLAANLLILYSLVKYPFWEIKIFVSRRVVFGSLSAAAALLYLLVSGWAMGLLNAAQAVDAAVIVPAAMFAFVGLLLYVYLSPTLRQRLEAFIARNFFHSKYDYRYLWTQFSERIAGSIQLSDILPKITEFIADCLFVRQVIVWLAAPGSTTFTVAYSLDDTARPRDGGLAFRLEPDEAGGRFPDILQVSSAAKTPAQLPFSAADLAALRVTHLLPVKKGGEILGWVGIGDRIGGQPLAVEDEQLLVSIVTQLANAILTARLSSELLEAREWESFNRLASFVIHDLKNLATQQSMVLDNAKRFRSNPEFLQDAFKTFAETTDKMISLIANLSVQRGNLVLNHQPVDIVELLQETFRGLSVFQRNGVRLVTDFPARPKPLLVSGDPKLLEKAFANILLNALQSLPDGKGTIEVKVANPNGKILTSVADTGCGIPPEQLRNLFRPFQTTKKGGTGIGLCHTRTIVESHQGHIRIQSEPNRGTRVEIELPAHAAP
ncbi:MAG TPA: XrtA/PEP-CTERM system histidine kinase PrsK [Candidatus Acidoferrales bacterium]|nr:XrtA/PEP-CTERM system histidine kinase PrsK [Candidatus Acidoferrales bacterium]